MKKIATKLLKTLASSGRLEYMALLCINASLVPSVGVLLEAFQAGGRRDMKSLMSEIDLIWKMSLSMKFRVNLTKAAIYYGAETALPFAVSIKNSTMAEFFLRHAGAESFLNEEDTQRILVLLELSSHAAVTRFRRRCVNWGELELSNTIAGFQKTALTTPELESIIVNNLRLPDLQMAIRAAQQIPGRKLSEKELEAGIAEDISDGSWRSVFKAFHYLNRNLTKKELQLMEKAAGSW